MKRISYFLVIFISIFFLFSTIFAGDVWVNGYTRKDGTYVPGHHRSAPDSNPWNNYSTRGNINPYTGKSGYVDPYKSYSPNPYKSKPHKYNIWSDD
jgi:hypothetical protein